MRRLAAAFATHAWRYHHVMCGKFTQMMSWRELHELSEFLKPVEDEGVAETVTPMRFANVIRLSPLNGARESVRMRWGFASRKARSPTERPEHIHARAETIDTRPTFRDAFRDRRGLLIVKTFNEGEEVTPTKTRQHVVSPRDRKPLGIAVLWEEWTHPEQDSLFTFVMVTVSANRLIGAITDRMPAVLEPKDWSAWLGETPASPDALKAMLTPMDGAWDMAPEQKQPPPPKPPCQPDLF